MTESSNWRAKSFIRISISSKLIELFAAVMVIYIGRTICESIRKITLIEGAEKGNKNKLGNFSEIFLKLATWSLGGFSNFSLIFFFFLKRWRQNYLVLTLAARCRDYRLARNAAGTSAFSCGEYSRGRPMLCREWWLSHRLTFRHWNCVCNTRASVHCHSLARRHHRRITFVIDVMILSSTPTYFHCVSKVSRDWR